MVRIGAMRGARYVSVALVAACLAVVVGLAGEDEPGEPLREWLVLGPAPAPLPAFHDQKPGSYPLATWLAGRQYPGGEAHPRAGQAIPWASGATLTWERVPAGEHGVVPLAGGSGPQVVYLAAYLRVDRYTEADLVIASHHLLRVD